MEKLPPDCKEFTLPAGSMVKIGDFPYELAHDTVVYGAMTPDMAPATAGCTDQQVTKKRNSKS